MINNITRGGVSYNVYLVKNKKEKKIGFSFKVGPLRLKSSVPLRFERVLFVVKWDPFMWDYGTDRTLHVRVCMYVHINSSLITHARNFLNI